MSLGQNVGTVSWNGSFEPAYLKPYVCIHKRAYVMLKTVFLEHDWTSIYKIFLFGTLYLGHVWNSMFGTLYFGHVWNSIFGTLYLGHVWNSIFGLIFLEHNV